MPAPPRQPHIASPPHDMDFQQQATFYTVYNLTLALLAPVKRDSFLYWPYLVSMVVLGAGAWAWRKRVSADLDWKGFLRTLFGWRLWWHRSARADYRLYLVNALLLPGLFSLTLLSHQELAAWLSRHLGMVQQGIAPDGAWGWRLAYTLVFFVTYDFGRYLAHYLLHRIPVLWAFHKVHHSAEVLTPITAFRAHPIDLLVMAWGSTLLTTPAFLVFNHLAGGRLDVYTFLGLHVLFFAGNLIGNLRHSPIWMSYGPTLGKWFISPAHHQIHHSAEPRHWGRNIGFELAVWDRLFGTLYLPASQQEEFVMGLDVATDPRWQTVRHMLFAPFLEVFRILSGRPAAELEKT